MFELSDSIDKEIKQGCVQSAVLEQHREHDNDTL